LAEQKWQRVKFPVGAGDHQWHTKTYITLECGLNIRIERALEQRCDESGQPTTHVEIATKRMNKALTEKNAHLVRPVHAEPDIKHLRAAQADALHRLKVGGDPFLGDVSDHPMPPSQRPCLERRVLESGDERISRLELLSRRLRQATGSTGKHSGKEKSTAQSESKHHRREGMGINAACQYLADS
jgi:hypothetical protein